MNYYHIESGLLYSSHVRGLLQSLKFQQQVEAYEENKAWHGSVFLIRGYTPYAEQRLDAFVAQIEAEQAAQEAKREAEQAESGSGLGCFILTIVAIIAAFVGAHIFLAK